MATVYLIFALVIAVIAVAFALQNTATVTVAFLTWKITGSLSLVLLVTLAIGVLIGWLFLAPSMIRNTFRTSSHRKRIGALEKELEDHKAKLSEIQRPMPMTPAKPEPIQPPQSSEPPQQPS